MALKRIRLELAGTADFPQDAPSYGYEFIAPLDRTGKIDFKKWVEAKGKCTVRRFWRRTIDEHGMLLHRRDGNWVFTWPGRQPEHELTFQFGKDPLIPGAYVSATEPTGTRNAFRVAEVQPMQRTARRR